MRKECATCGNHYDKCFEIKTHEGKTYLFDCFECAISLLAPKCEHCGLKMIGHGLEMDSHYYCCAHCSKGEGIKELRDRY